MLNRFDHFLTEKQSQKRNRLSQIWLFIDDLSSTRFDGTLLTFYLAIG